ncbi:MAG: TadE/TadG family type IV pilus assembly protein [Alphaproteobacteria bacterium]
MLKQFQKDISASAASEFALVIPFMLILLLGVVETSQILMVKRKVTAVAQNCADLISRETSITNTELADVVKAVSMIFYPLPTQNLGINISSIVFDESNNPSLDWELTESEITLLGDPVLDDVTGLGEANGSVIVVSVTYKHNLLFPTLFGSSYNFFERSYAKPRRSAKVTKE